MLILVPILLLLLFAAIIQFFGRYRHLSIGSTWLITAGSVVLVWIIMIVLRAVLPKGISIDDWSPLGIASDQLVFKLSENTWIFAFLLVSLLVAIILTDTVRLGQGNNLATWTGSMLLTTVGLFSIYSQTLLAVILSWTIIDIVEIGILISVINHQKMHSAAVVEFTLRIMGTMLVIAALILSKAQNVIEGSTQFSHAVYLLLILGATLRLGVLPLHIPLTANLPIRRSLGTILRFVSPLSVLSFLSQVQPQLQYSKVILFFIPIALITALYGATKWASAANELTGRPYWMLAFSGLVLASFVQGHTEAIVALSIIMVLGGGYIFLRSSATRFSFILGVVCLIEMTGFPFTPTSPLWNGSQTDNALLANLGYSITIFILFIGFLRHLLRSRKEEAPKEMWMHLFHSVGLILLVLIPWITIIWRFSEIRAGQEWVGPIICIMLCGLSFGIKRTRTPRLLLENPAFQKIKAPAVILGRALNEFFTFEWFYLIFKRLFGLITLPIRFFVNILEGDGGLLWSLLFLALIASVLVGEITF